MTLKYYNFTYQHNRDDSNICDLLDDIRKEQGENFDVFEFKELIKYGVLEEVIEKCDWIKEQIEFVLNVYEQLKKKKIGNKRKLSSILCDL